MFKRLFLFLATNLAVIVLLGLVANLFGLSYHSGQLAPLLVFASIIGFGGSFISLMLSKTMAKWSTGATIIKTPRDDTDRWLLTTVEKLAQTANIKMPEVGIYEGGPNAFATGATKNSSLVCVSTGLLATMNRDEVEGVLGHEMAHVANGDMVTLALIQGVVNTFVVFLSRLIASIVASGSRGNNDSNSFSHGAYYITSMICELVFGLLASIIVAYFSRRREYRADAGSVYLLGQPKKMVAALQKLQAFQAGELPRSMAAFGIADKPSKLLTLFATHPPLEDRIKALQESRYPPSLD